jgi:hypothetical protein
MQSLSNTLKYSLFLFLAAFLSACGGGGGGTNGAGTASPAGTGTVTVLITDGPSNDFDAINITVTKAELLSDTGRVTLFSGNKTFDLLTLANATEIFSVADVPAGRYSKIRLTLNSIELVKEDGSKFYPKLPGNGKLDLNPHGDFDVLPGVTMLIQLDMDAEKSIHVVRTGAAEKYNFRPVVFVNIIQDKFDTRLVRLRGTVDKLDSVTGDFDLCLIAAQPLTVSNSNNDPVCVQIETDSGTSFFDVNGDPADISSLANGDIATAVGRFRFDGNTLIINKRDDDEGEDDDDGDDHTYDRGQLVLLAEVVWQGDFAELTGVARSAVTVDTTRGSWFEFEVDPGQGILFDAPVPTILQTGTKIFSREGLPLPDSAIQDGVPAKVDGVLDTGNDDLKAALIILDTDIQFSQLTGIIGSVAQDFGSMILQTDTGDRCVTIDTSTRVFETSLGNDNSINFDQKTASDLEAGQMADAFGEYSIDGCMQADTIIFESEDDAQVQPVP